MFDDLSDKEIVEELHSEMKRVSEQVEGPISQNDMRKKGDITPYYYEKYLGSWTEAKDKLGFEVSRREATDTELIAELRRLDAETEGMVTPGDMTDQGLYAENTYKRRFGSWSEAKEEAGLETQKTPEEELLSDIEELAHNLHRPPTIPDMREYGSYTPETYRQRFGSWTEAVEEAGFSTYDPKISERKLMEELKRVYEELDRRPKKCDMEEHGKYSASVYDKRFGSWNKALAEAEIFEGQYPTGPDNHQWEGGDSSNYYGPAPYVDKQKHKVRERDGDKCRVCGYDNPERKNPIHHIEPRHKYENLKNPDNYVPLNDVNNLITLCYDCHQMYEGRWQDSDPDEFAQLAKQAENQQRIGGNAW